ncbi:MAG: hypothetical protein J7L52_01405 [Thermotogae bacterium]|nr:hypothetical protein [Thermotogota bacterium]
MKVVGVSEVGAIRNMEEVHRNYLIRETAKVVYGEAGSVKDDEEKLWAAHVVKNRYMLQKQGKYRFGSIRKDFLGYERWGKNRGAIENNRLEKRAWEKSLEAARKAWTSKHDPTNGAVFFVSREFLKKKGIKDPSRADLVNKNINLSIYPLEYVKPPEGHNFAHAFYRIKGAKP